MKKEYIKPSVKTIRISAHSMLAGSTLNPGEGGSGNSSEEPAASKEEGDDIDW